MQRHLAGNSGEWRYVALDSSEDNFVFVRGAAVAVTGARDSVVKGKAITAQSRATAVCSTSTAAKRKKVAAKPAATAVGKSTAKPAAQKRKSIPAAMQGATLRVTRQSYAATM